MKDNITLLIYVLVIGLGLFVTKIYPVLNPPVVEVTASRAKLEPIFQSPFRLASEAGFAPFLEGDGDGVTIVSLKPGTPLKDLGLQNGDVLVQVEDTTITSKEVLKNVYDQYRSQNEITYEVLRDGKKVHFKATFE